MASTSPKGQSKRHLIRWNEALDKKLLLCMQLACNQDGLKIPWGKVGELMNDNNTGGPITEGAIVQHLAKTRIRMVEEDLPVPPPLKRGGKARISISAPNHIGRGSRATHIAATGSNLCTNKANGRRPIALKAESAATSTNRKIRKTSVAKSNAKKACKYMSDEEVDSELDGEYDEESGSDSWRPRSRLTKPSGNGAKKNLGKRLNLGESSEEDKVSKSFKLGEKRKRGNIKIEVDEPFDDGDEEGDENCDGEDSDDETISAASGDFVGKNASFLLIDIVTNSPTLSDPPDSFIITLNWGKAYPTKLTSYALALARLIERGIVQPEAPEIYTDDEEDGEYDKDVVVAPLGYAVTPFKIEEDEIDNLHKNGHFHEVTADALSYNNSSDTTEVARRFGGFPAHRPPPFNETHTANVAHLNDDPANCLSHSMNRPPYAPFLDFGPRDLEGHPYSDISFVDTRFCQHDTFDSHSQDAIPQCDRFNAVSFGKLVETPVGLNLPPVAPELNHRSNFNSDINSYRPDDFHDYDGATFDVGYPSHTAYTHGDIQSSFQGHSLALFDSHNSDTTQSSSANNSFTANVPSHTQTLYPLTSDFETNETSFEVDEQTQGLDTSQWDAEHPNKEFGVHDMFDFGQFQ